MKPEAEIRKHLATLKALDRPCPHKHDRPQDAVECNQGWLMITSSIAVLEWALGDPNGYDRIVEEMAAGVLRGEHL